MLKRISRRFTPAHAIALLALFVALGGSAYAANSINGALLERGSVPGSKLKRGAVTSAKLASNAVTGAKIANGRVGRSDLAAAAVTRAKLAADSVDGSKLADGSVGSADLTPFSFTQPVLQNGWGISGLTTVPGFGKDAAGFVHLRGQILDGTLNTSAFQLPAGLRPSQAAQFGALHIFGGNSTACVVTISTSGDVTIGLLTLDTGCAGTAGLYSLDGITFRAG